MRYYTFRPRFHAKILAAKKYSTIRFKQKVKPGEVFSLRTWTGLPYRSPQGLLGTARCERVSPIIITHWSPLSFTLAIKKEICEQQSITFTKTTPISSPIFLEMIGDIVNHYCKADGLRFPMEIPLRVYNIIVIIDQSQGMPRFAYQAFCEVLP